MPRLSNVAVFVRLRAAYLALPWYKQLFFPWKLKRALLQPQGIETSEQAVFFIHNFMYHPTSFTARFFKCLNEFKTSGVFNRFNDLQKYNIFSRHMDIRHRQLLYNSPDPEDMAYALYITYVGNDSVVRVLRSAQVDARVAALNSSILRGEKSSDIANYFASPLRPPIPRLDLREVEAGSGASVNASLSFSDPGDMGSLPPPEVRFSPSPLLTEWHSPSRRSHEQTIPLPGSPDTHGTPHSLNSEREVAALSY